MADKKITKRENFSNIMEYLTANGKTEWAEVIAHEIELLDRKGSKSAKETPAQKDKASISVIIKEILAECEDARGMTVGAILKDSRISGFMRYNGEMVNSQLVTSALTDMTAPTEKYPNRTNEIKNIVEKKVSYYSLNTEVEGE